MCRDLARPVCTPCLSAGSPYAWPRQASVVSPCLFAGMCCMIDDLVHVLCSGCDVLRDLTEVSPRAMVRAKAKEWMSGML
jgi:hypothetical protein